MLILLLSLPNRLVQRHHKRYIAFVRLFQQKKFGDIVVLDLVVVPTEEEHGVMVASTSFPKDKQHIAGHHAFSDRIRTTTRTNGDLKDLAVRLEKTTSHDGRPKKKNLSSMLRVRLQFKSVWKNGPTWSHASS